MGCMGLIQILTSVGKLRHSDVITRVNKARKSFKLDTLTSPSLHEPGKGPFQRKRSLSTEKVPLLFKFNNCSELTIVCRSILGNKKWSFPAFVIIKIKINLLRG
uniref:Uncharacterized protein n=1 Tax=Cacopsylla melanoneura TaxID=428564 RepID=A0A8D8WTD1_9HEMI